MLTNSITCLLCIATVLAVAQLSRGAKFTLNPQCLKDVGVCRDVYLQQTTDVSGRHVWLTDKIPADTKDFCKVNFVNFRSCVKPFKDKCRNEVDTILHAYDYLCHDQNRNGWTEYHNCYRTNYTEALVCNEDFKESWVAVEEYEIGKSTIIVQCGMLQTYLRCVKGFFKFTECGNETVASWFSDFHIKSWTPLKNEIICDVYGATGGVKGIIAGVMVAVLFVVVCFVCVWCRKKNKGVINSRTSTSL